MTRLWILVFGTVYTVFNALVFRNDLSFDPVCSRVESIRNLTDNSAVVGPQNGLCKTLLSAEERLIKLIKYRTFTREGDYNNYRSWSFTRIFGQTDSS